MMNCLVPLLITLMLTTGSIVSANVVQPVLLLVIGIIGNLISNFIILLSKILNVKIKSVNKKIILLNCTNFSGTYKIKCSVRINSVSGYSVKTADFTSYSACFSVKNKNISLRSSCYNNSITD